MKIIREQMEAVFPKIWDLVINGDNDSKRLAYELFPNKDLFHWWFWRTFGYSGVIMKQWEFEDRFSTDYTICISDVYNIEDELWKQYKKDSIK